MIEEQERERLPTAKDCFRHLSDYFSNSINGKGRKDKKSPYVATQHIAWFVTGESYNGDESNIVFTDRERLSSNNFDCSTFDGSSSFHHVVVDTPSSIHGAVLLRFRRMNCRCVKCRGAFEQCFFEEFTGDYVMHEKKSVREHNLNSISR
jgi:hypothetical protein